MNVGVSGEGAALRSIEVVVGIRVSLLLLGHCEWKVRMVRGGVMWEEEEEKRKGVGETSWGDVP